MAKYRKDITPEEILAWADLITGRPLKESAEAQNCTAQTIINRRKRVQEFIGERFDINEYRLPIHGLFPLWVKSVINNLAKNDVTLTIALGKGMGYLIDKHESDINFGGISDAELDRLIERAKSGATKPIEDIGGEGSEREDTSTD